MKRILALTALIIALIPTTARAEKIEGLEINLPAQGMAINQTIDMGKYKHAGVQAVYGDGTPAAHTLVSGSKEAATITVPTATTALISAQASVTVNVLSTTTALTDSVTLDGVVFKEGTHWVVGTTSFTSADNLGARIDAHPDFVATVSGSTITVKYAEYGTVGNGKAATTTDATAFQLGAATFASGINRESLTIAGVTLTEGVDFNANSSSYTTTNNIAAAINANATLAAKVIASSATVVTTVTALKPGRNYYSVKSSTTGFTTSGFNLGADTNIDIDSDVFTKASHGFTTGLRVLYATVSGTAPGGLTTGTTYFAIKLNEDTYQLATSSTNALAGTDIDITSLPTTSSSYSLSPLALAVLAGNGFKWQGSNDGTNFSDLAIASVTYSAAGNALWDLDEYAYKYLRMVFTAPTSGGISVAVRIYGIEE